MRSERELIPDFPHELILKQYVTKALVWQWLFPSTCHPTESVISKSPSQTGGRPPTPAAVDNLLF